MGHNEIRGLGSPSETGGGDVWAYLTLRVVTRSLLVAVGSMVEGRMVTGSNGGGDEKCLRVGPHVSSLRRENYMAEECERSQSVVCEASRGDTHWSGVVG